MIASINLGGRVSIVFVRECECRLTSLRRPRPYVAPLSAIPGAPFRRQPAPRNNVFVVPRVRALDRRATSGQAPCPPGGPASHKRHPVTPAFDPPVVRPFPESLPRMPCRPRQQWRLGRAVQTVLVSLSGS